MKVLKFILGMVISFALINSCNENEEKYDSLNIE